MAATLSAVAQEPPWAPVEGFTTSQHTLYTAMRARGATPLVDEPTPVASPLVTAFALPAAVEAVCEP